MIDGKRERWYGESGVGEGFIGRNEELGDTDIR